MECTTVTTTDPTLTLATTAAYRPTTQQNLTAHLERVSEAVLLRSQFSVAQFSPPALSMTVLSFCRHSLDCLCTVLYERISLRGKHLLILSRLSVSPLRLSTTS